MNRTAPLFLTAALSFIAGLLSYAAGSWWLRTSLLPPGTITVRGVLKFQAQIDDLSTSGNPPNGYFVESNAIERFYVEGDLIEPYVGSSVFIQGEVLSTLCGPDTFPCYPKLHVKSVTQVSE
ncbi:MAG: hypothetical protein HY785_22095 [Oscillatoriophycideae cyanobacterium NC_groundwater_1537_Pr4_S-0.65um_50_18]|nr:hypothetical protein [Oscillatoriophycideae cyanobacterium NC_groundwater_1537_Pr4_S-0.65um_50_18]